MLLTDSFYNYQRKERNCVMTNQKTNSAKIAKMAMLVAISIVLVMVIHLPIFPAVAFLEYDPADIPILVGAFAFGPVAGLILTVVTSLIQGLTDVYKRQPHELIKRLQDKRVYEKREPHTQTLLSSQY